jgi:hypothetical protein
LMFDVAAVGVRVLVVLPLAVTELVVLDVALPVAAPVDVVVIVAVVVVLKPLRVVVT